MSVREKVLLDLVDWVWEENGVVMQALQLLICGRFSQLTHPLSHMLLFIQD